MANVQIKDGAEAEKYLKSTGAGSDGDAYIPQHLETNSADIKTAVELLDNAISGSEMQVDVVTLPALVAGSAAIGKLAANSGVDIGDVTLTAGAASIGTLGANSGVDIGDVTLNAGTTEVGKVTSLLATDSLRNE